MGKGKAREMKKDQRKTNEKERMGKYRKVRGRNGT